MILVLACCTTILIIVTPNMGLNSHENEISYQVTKNKAINRKRGRVKLTFRPLKAHLEGAFNKQIKVLNALMDTYYMVLT